MGIPGDGAAHISLSAYRDHIQDWSFGKDIPDGFADEVRTWNGTATGVRFGLGDTDGDGLMNYSAWYPVKRDSAVPLYGLPLDHGPQVGATECRVRESDGHVDLSCYRFYDGMRPSGYLKNVLSKHFDSFD